MNTVSSGALQFQYWNLLWRSLEGWRDGRLLPDFAISSREPLRCPVHVVLAHWRAKRPTPQLETLAKTGTLGQKCLKLPVFACVFKCVSSFCQQQRQRLRVQREPTQF